MCLYDLISLGIFYMFWFVSRNGGYWTRRIQWTCLSRENHVSLNKILGDISQAWERDCSVLVFLCPQGEGWIGVKFESNFTENSDKDHVELRIKRVSVPAWVLGVTHVLISSLGIIFTQQKSITVFNPYCYAFLCFDIALCKKPRIGSLELRWFLWAGFSYWRHGTPLPSLPLLSPNLCHKTWAFLFSHPLWI